MMTATQLLLSCVIAGIAMVSPCPAADSGRIVGSTMPNPRATGLRRGVAWAATGDCRVFYRAVIDDHSRFAFDFVRPDSYTIWGVLDGFPRFLLGEAEVHAGETSQVVLADTSTQLDDGSVMEQSGPVYGRILDTAGNPISGASVAMGKGRGWSVVESRSDGQFAFCSVAPAGTSRGYNMVIKHQGDHARRFRVTHEIWMSQPLDIKLEKR